MDFHWNDEIDDVIASVAGDLDNRKTINTIAQSSNAMNKVRRLLSPNSRHHINSSLMIADEYMKQTL